MAKTPKINMTLLGTIAAATVAGGFHYVSQADGKPLLEAGLIEINTSMLDSAGNAAARTTDAGAEKVKGAQAPAPAAAPNYGLIGGAVLPPARKRGGGGGAPAQYPFASMEIGQSFFVPVSDKHPTPVKTLSSTVSNWNATYAEETGETKQVKRAKRGEDGKPIKGEDGKNVMEDAIVPVTRQTRKFAVAPVEKGKTYGEWVAPEDGALVSRVAVA